MDMSEAKTKKKT